MHFGEPLDEPRFIQLIRLAYEKGIRTFMTSDVYGNGASDEILGKALEPFPRESYCLVGAIGHDFYTGKREGSKGYPRFTDPALRSPGDFKTYLETATQKSLARCGTEYFDLLLLHNPDSIGYTSDAVWSGMQSLKQSGLTTLLGIAPGPANGFTLDLIQSIEKFHQAIDWAMIIFNPLENWPGSLVLPAAKKHGVKIITRVVDYGGLFHDDILSNHTFRKEDHRVFRPAGWIETGRDKMERMRPIAQKHGLTMLQFACIWNLSQEPVESVIPTLIQEAGENARLIEDKVAELAALPKVKFSADEIAEIAAIGNNKGCMNLKGGNPDFTGPIAADQWPLTPELVEAGSRWGINPAQDLIYSHKPK
jgi:aryl-alcohol dehydrogenase-like predicted oxidoreductase